MNSVTIVGGGVIGMLSAIQLQQAGLEVRVIDRQSFGRESSWAGGGIISPLFPWRYPDAVTRLARLSQQIYGDLVAQLQQQVNIDPEYLPSGMLVLGDYSAENPRAWAEQHQINMQAVDRAQIRELAPEVAEGYHNGWWFPQVHQVRNPRLVALLKAYLQQSAISLVEDDPVSEILLEGPAAIGVQTESSRYYSDITVIAGGAWSGQLLAQTGLMLDIRPIKGQMLLLNGPPGLVRHITLADDRYIIPRKDGRVLIGSTTEDCGFNKDTSEQVKQQLLDYAAATIPQLADCELETHWSGLRPGSGDGIPTIGAHPAVQNLYINSGHYRNGLVLAPASALLLRQIIMRNSASLAPEDYRVAV
ncbi:MAG: glycine oxidase ThiO [Gammaproteobacteria bacterium]|nr:glycine oxidase ThiO [Gammaproteobacteria bacterium]